MATKKKVGVPKKGKQAQKASGPSKKKVEAETKNLSKDAKPESSSKLLFCACVVCIFVSYLIYGLIQESFGSIKYKENEDDPGQRFKFTTFTLFVQCTMNALFSFVVMCIIKFNKRNDMNSPIRTMNCFSLTRSFATKFAILAVTQSLAMLCSHKSIYYVSYPTQVIAKCCKPIPILIISLILGSSSYSRNRIISVILITIGVTIFMYENAIASGKASSTSSSSDSLLGWWIGIGFLCMSLASDGFTGHFQNRTKRENYKDMDKSISSWHMMFFSNVFSSVFFFIAMVISQEAIPAIQFCMKFRTVIWLVLISAVVSAVGQGFIYITVTWYDPLITSIVTTIRKFISIVLSVFLYGHKISIIQWISAVVVFLGVFLGSISDKKKPKLKTD